jgi:hypothetical protein
VARVTWHVGSAYEVFLLLSVLSESKAGRPRRREAVVAEARGDASVRRQRRWHRRLTRRRINEGGDEVRVSGCWGGMAPVTSPEYRGCWGLDRRWGCGGAVSTTGGRPTVGGARGGGIGGSCRWRKPKNVAETEEDDRRQAEPTDSGMGRCQR